MAPSISGVASSGEFCRMISPCFRGGWPNLLAIAEAVDLYDPEHEHDFEHVIARGTPPTHGENGRFDLDDAIKEVLDRAAKLKRRRPATSDNDQPADEIEGDACHYQRTTIAAVTPGMRIGRVVSPTLGEDGVDVCGGCAPARDGAQSTIDVDRDTIELQDDGALFARVGGLLDTGDNCLRVSEDLVIHGDVDFSTGNVQFDGNITVERGIKDCFVVDSTRSTTVVGQVEAATLRSGRDTILRRGMTGREKGEICAGRDVRTRFIDSATIAVGRDLHVDREMTHCSTTVGRNVIAPEAAMYGGECTVGGTAEFAQVGSESNTATLLRLGAMPELDRLMREAAEILPQVQQRGTNAKQQLELLQANTAKLTASQAESMTELQFVVMNAESKLNPLRKSIDGAIQLLERSTNVSLTVHNRVMPGVN
ncbi:MAG: FapA family protein, partial [Planctomycetota bacterium]